MPIFASVQGYYGYGFAQTFIMVVFAAMFLYIVLSWLYNHRYSSKTALGIMGSVPIVVLTFILLFLKLHIPTPEMFIVLSPIPGGHVGGSESVTYQPFEENRKRTCT